MKDNVALTNLGTINRIEDITSALKDMEKKRLNCRNSIQFKKAEISSHLEEQERLLGEVSRLENACNLLKDTIAAQENNLSVLKENEGRMRGLRSAYDNSERALMTFSQHWELLPDGLKSSLLDRYPFPFPNSDKTSSSSVRDIPTKLIKVAPKRLQFKILGSLTKDGIVGSLSGVKSWDSNLAGILLVWEDPKNSFIYVVNGHNRLAKARELGIESLTCRFIKANTAKEARSIGALANIAEGQGTAIDVAKFFRDTNLSASDLEAKGIGIRNSLARDGLALSKLSPNLFSKLINGDLPTNQGIAIGSSGLDAIEQDELYKMIGDRRMRAEALTELTDLVRSAPQYEQTSLFSELGFDSSENLALIKADLQAAIKVQFNKSKRLFDTVSKRVNSDTLQGAGVAEIDADKSQENSANIARIILYFDLNKNGDTELSKLLNKGAIAVREGAKKSKVVKDLERTFIESPRIILGDAYDVKPDDIKSDTLCELNLSVDSKDSKKVLTDYLCPKKAKQFDLICSDTGIPPGEVSSLLLMLELEGKVRQLPGMNFLLT